MRKKIILIIVLLLFPTNILAYSNEIIPGGENIGIKIETDGILIIGFYKIDGKVNKGNPSLKVGDIIIKVNNENVYSVEDLTTLLENNRNNQIQLTIKRKNDIKTIDFSLIKVDDIYKTGLYVKDSLTGIGTLTYIDPETKIYGALGHEIIESTTNDKIEIKSGTIFKSLITGIDRSSNGTPGGKNARFFSNTKYGTILKNTDYGIYGIYESELPNKDLLEIGKPSLGEAEILTVLKDNTINSYKINIETIKEKSSIKNLYFKITDEELLNKAGGIVQGMSGSPIIQNNKIIGAVTHVIIDEVTTGYGILIETMLKEGEK